MIPTSTSVLDNIKYDFYHGNIRYVFYYDSMKYDFYYDNIIYDIHYDITYDFNYISHLVFMVESR